MTGKEKQIVQERQVHLTKREREILVEIALGCRNKEIAETLAISEQTVKNHITLLMVRLGVRGRSKLAVYAALGGSFPSEESLKARWLGECEPKRRKSEKSPRK